MDPGSLQWIHPDFQEGPGGTTTNGEVFQVLLSIPVILDDPARLGMLVDVSLSRKVSAAWSGWDGGMMHHE